jgi:hypothetical protein
MSKRKTVVVEAESVVKKKANKTKDIVLENGSDSPIYFTFSSVKKKRKEEVKPFVNWQFFEGGETINQEIEGWKTLGPQCVKYLAGDFLVEYFPSQYMRHVTSKAGEVKLANERWVRCEHPIHPGKFVFFALNKSTYSFALRLDDSKEQKAAARARALAGENTDDDDEEE